MSWYSTIFNRSRASKNSWKDDRKVKTVYGEGTLGEQRRRSHYVHWVLKYKLLVPAAAILDKWIKKKIGTPNLNRKPMDLLRVFDLAMNVTDIEWIVYYLRQGTGTPEQYKEAIEMVEKGTGNVRIPQSMKRSYITVCANDDAYLERHNLLMLNIYKLMHEYLSENNVDGKHYHLMRNYKGSIGISPVYEAVYLQFKMKEQFEIHEILRGVKSGNPDENKRAQKRARSTTTEFSGKSEEDDEEGIGNLKARHEEKGIHSTNSSVAEQDYRRPPTSTSNQGTAK